MSIPTLKEALERRCPQALKTALESLGLELQSTCESWDGWEIAISDPRRSGRAAYIVLFRKEDENDVIST